MDGRRNLANRRMIKLASEADLRLARVGEPSNRGVPSTPDQPAGDGEPTDLVAIESLRPARSPRLNGEDPEHTRRLAEAGVTLPPIVVHRATMRIIDGTHRVGAARLRGESNVAARFFDGTEQEAFTLAVRANITHGLPLTHADRVAAAETLIKRNPCCSDRSLAATTGLSAGTISSIRRRILPARDGDETRVGRDGRARPVDPAIGRDRAREILERSPDASLRQVARQAGVSPSTVRDVRKRMQRVDERPDAVASASRTLPEPADLRRRGPREDTGPRAGFNAGITLENLSRDPSLRHTESGRALLRWLSTRVVRRDEWRTAMHRVPPHAAYIIAELALQCAEEWSHLAYRLKEHARQAG